MKPNDQLVLRELASEVAEIAALPAQQETIALWHGLNGLRPARPMVMIDEIPWNEMDVDRELTLQTEDGFCRGLEATLRQTLYAWRHFPVDMVVEPVIDIPKVIRTDGFGVGIEETTLATADDNVILSHHYVDQFRTDDDVGKIRVPVITLDEGATASTEARAHEMFDGILDVRMQGMFLTYEIWDDITMWRGAENVLFDLIDRPAFMHEIASRYIDAKLAMLDQLEARGLLGYGQPRVHCTGAHTDAPGAGLRIGSSPRKGQLDLRDGADPLVRVARDVRGVRGRSRDQVVLALRPRVLRLLRCAPRSRGHHPPHPQRSEDLDEPVGRRGQGGRADRSRLCLLPQAQPSSGRHGNLGAGGDREGPAADAGRVYALWVPGGDHPEGHQHRSLQAATHLGVGGHRVAFSGSLETGSVPAPLPALALTLRDPP